LGLLNDIECAATTSLEPLADVLRRCKILAARLNYPELESWVESELTGYPEEAKLPGYRIVSTPLSRGTLAGTSGRQLKNAPLPMAHLPSEQLRALTEHGFRESVSTLAEMAKNDGTLRIQWPPAMVAQAQHSFYGGMELLSAWSMLPPGCIAGVIDTVRTRVLDFVIALQGEGPVLGAEEEDARIGREVLAKAFGTTIIGGNASVGTTRSWTFRR
jgi:AbiTii